MDKNKSKGAKLYKKYKGRKANCDGIKGVVCGHDDKDLIMAVIETNPNNKGWDSISPFDQIDDEFKNNPQGYLYIRKDEVI